MRIVAATQDDMDMTRFKAFLISKIGRCYETEI